MARPDTCFRTPRAPARLHSPARVPAVSLHPPDPRPVGWRPAARRVVSRAFVSASQEEAPRVPSTRARAAAAVGIGVLAAAFVFTSLALKRGLADFEFWWRAARLYAQGVDPYLLAPLSAQWPLPDRLFYPLPALWLTLPVAWLPLPVAGALSLGTASGTLAWLLARDGWWRLWALASPAFIMAIKVGQWSPLMCIALLVPAVGALTVVKPTLGAAVLAAPFNVRAAIGGAALLLASVVAMPRWPMEWLDNLRHVVSHPAPVATPLGAVLLLAVLRWRQAEARLLLAMACVPQLLFFADQLPVLLVARTRGEAMFLSACGMAAWLAWDLGLSPTDLYVLKAAPYVLLGVYLPALLVVLRHPNRGPVPRDLATLRAWWERARQRRAGARGAKSS